MTHTPTLWKPAHTIIRAHDDFVATLKWYADEKNYQFNRSHIPMVYDRGRMAQEILTKHGLL
jgi:hypothetical protein